MDWDEFMQDGVETERTLRDVSSRMEQQNAESRRTRTRAAVRAVKRLRVERARDDGSGEARRAPGTPFVVREGPPEGSLLSIDERLKAFEADTRLVLAEIRRDVLMLRRDVDRISRPFNTDMPACIICAPFKPRTGPNEA